MGKITELLEKTGLPFAYDHFAEGESPEPPFITYIVEGTENFCADCRVYAVVLDIGIELYTDRYEPDTEKRLERVLDAEDIPWDRESEWIGPERMYQTTYDITLIEESEEEEDE